LVLIVFFLFLLLLGWRNPWVHHHYRPGLLSTLICTPACYVTPFSVNWPTCIDKRISLTVEKSVHSYFFRRAWHKTPHWKFSSWKSNVEVIRNFVNGHNYI
jgi:hypothetical protein